VINEVVWFVENIVVFVTTSSICKLLTDTFRLTDPEETLSCPVKGVAGKIVSSIGRTRELPVQFACKTLTTTCPFPAINPEGFVEDAENLFREKVTVDP
jgi:hypothetical protein